jgi:hypothetical protein
VARSKAVPAAAAPSIGFRAFLESPAYCGLDLDAINAHAEREAAARRAASSPTPSTIEAPAQGKEEP